MQKGFSTVEMMIAMVIIIIVLATVIITSFGNQNFLIGAQTNQEAVNIANETLEITQADSRKDFRIVNPKTETTSSDGYYTMWTDVGPSLSNPNDNFTKQVTSHVKWTDDSKITRNVKFSTLITNFTNAIGGDTCNSFLTGNWTSPQKTDRLFGTIVGDSLGLYPVTDIDVYKGKAYVSVSSVGTSPTAGANNPAIANGTTGAGSINWTNPNNIFSSDNNRATAALTSGNTSHYIKASKFGFNIPSWATIIGIKVEVQRSIAGSTNGGVKDSEVRIIKADGAISSNISSNKADTVTAWPVVGSESYALYNPSDLWSENWSPADINDPDFGVAISAVATSSRTAQVNHVKITITYTRQFYVLNTTNPTNPTFSSSLGSNTITTGINAVTTDGNYAYLATTSTTGQLQVVDVSVTPPKVVSILKLGTTSGVGNAIFYKNGYVYIGITHVGTGPEFYIVDVHNPNLTSTSIIGNYTLGNDINSVKVRNQYAYLATPNSQELKILNISDPALPTLAGNFDAPDAIGNGKSLDLVGDILYLGRTITPTSGGPGNPELYLVDISNQINIPLIPLGTKEVGSSVNGLLVRDYLTFLLSGTSGSTGALNIFNTSNPASIITYSPTISLPGTLPESIDCEGNYLYISSVPSSNKGSISIVTAL